MDDDDLRAGAPNRGRVYLLAGAAAGLALLALGLGAWAVSTRGGAGPAGREADLYGRVAGHPFWKVKVTPAQVREMVEKIRAEPRLTLVSVSDRLVCEATPNNGILTAGAKGRIIYGRRDGQPYREVLLGLNVYPDRPGGEELAAHLLQLIAERDYQD